MFMISNAIGYREWHTYCYFGTVSAVGGFYCLADLNGFGYISWTFATRDAMYLAHNIISTRTWASCGAIWDTVYGGISVIHSNYWLNSGRWNFATIVHLRWQQPS